MLTALVIRCVESPSETR